MVIRAEWRWGLPEWPIEWTIQGQRAHLVTTNPGSGPGLVWPSPPQGRTLSRVPDDVVTPGGIVVPSAAITWRFSRSSGPGGQGVNTADSRVELVVDLTALRTSRAVASRVRAALGDSLRIVASAERSQLRNREAALRRLSDRIDRAARPPRPRTPTRPSRSSVRRRLEAKRLRSEAKARRRPPGDDA